MLYFFHIFHVFFVYIITEAFCFNISDVLPVDESLDQVLRRNLFHKHHTYISVHELASYDFANTNHFSDEHHTNYMGKVFGLNGSKRGT